MSFDWDEVYITQNQRTKEIIASFIALDGKGPIGSNAGPFNAGDPAGLPADPEDGDPINPGDDGNSDTGSGGTNPGDSANGTTISPVDDSYTDEICQDHACEAVAQWETNTGYGIGKLWADSTEPVQRVNPVTGLILNHNGGDSIYASVNSGVTAGQSATATTLLPDQVNVPCGTGNIFGVNSGTFSELANHVQMVSESPYYYGPDNPTSLPGNLNVFQQQRFTLRVDVSAFTVEAELVRFFVQYETNRIRQGPGTGGNINVTSFPNNVSFSLYYNPANSTINNGPGGIVSMPVDPNNAVFEVFLNWSFLGTAGSGRGEYEFQVDCALNGRLVSVTRVSQSIQGGMDNYGWVGTIGEGAGNNNNIAGITLINGVATHISPVTGVAPIYRHIVTYTQPPYCTRVVR